MQVNDAVIKISIKEGSELVELVQVWTTRTKAFQVLDFLTGRTESVHLTSLEPRKLEKETKPMSPENIPALNIPSRSKLEAYIRSKNYNFTMEEIIKESAGREVSSKEGKAATNFLNAIRIKVSRIRQSIQDKEGGHWEEYQEGRYKRYKFIRSNNNRPFQEWSR